MSRAKDEIMSNTFLLGDWLAEREQTRQRFYEIREKQLAKENSMKSQIEKKLPPYGYFLMVYNSLNHAEKNYIRHGEDDRANDIRKRIKEFKKYRTEKEARELVTILTKIKAERKTDE